MPWRQPNFCCCAGLIISFKALVNPQMWLKMNCFQNFTISFFPAALPTGLRQIDLRSCCLRLCWQILGRPAFLFFVFLPAALPTGLRMIGVVLLVVVLLVVLLL